MENGLVWVDEGRDGWVIPKLDESFGEITTEEFDATNPPSLTISVLGVTPRDLGTNIRLWLTRFILTC